MRKLFATLCPSPYTSISAFILLVVVGPCEARATWSVVPSEECMCPSWSFDPDCDGQEFTMCERRSYGLRTLSSSTIEYRSDPVVCNNCLLCCWHEPCPNCQHDRKSCENASICKSSETTLFPDDRIVDPLADYALLGMYCDCASTQVTGCNSCDVSAKPCLTTIAKAYMTVNSRTCVLDHEWQYTVLFEYSQDCFPNPQTIQCGTGVTAIQCSFPLIFGHTPSACSFDTVQCGNTCF